MTAGLRHDDESATSELVVWSALVSGRDWAFVVDVGSHRGAALTDVQLPPGTAAVAFEPHPDRCASLRRAVALRGLPVRVEEMAVTSGIGTAELRRSERPPRMWTLEPVSTLGPEASIHVATTSLTGYFAGDDAESVCVRVSVPGHEGAVLAGSVEVLSRVRNAAVMLNASYLSDREIERLSVDWRLYAYDHRSTRFVEVSGSPRLAARVIRAGWCDPRQVVLVHRHASPPLTEMLRESSL